MVKGERAGRGKKAGQTIKGKEWIRGWRGEWGWGDCRERGVKGESVDKGKRRKMGKVVMRG